MTLELFAATLLEWLEEHYARQERYRLAAECHWIANKYRKQGHTIIMQVKRDQSANNQDYC